MYGNLTGFGCFYYNNFSACKLAVLCVKDIQLPSSEELMRQRTGGKLLLLRVMGANYRGLDWGLVEVAP